jgi:hypothetical protein
MILALLLSILASVGWLMLGAWYAGTFSNQFSLQDPGWDGLLARHSLLAFVLSPHCRSSFIRQYRIALSHKESELIRLK